MCDASDFAMGAVLGQRKEKIFRAISMLEEPSMKPKKTIQLLKRRC